MERAKRDSPERQKQEPTGHQKGKCQARGTSRKGTQKKGLEFIPALQGLCPPCPLWASFLITLLPAATPPAPSSFHYTLWLLIGLQRKPQIPAVTSFQDLLPNIPSTACPSQTPGAPGLDSFPSAIQMASVPVHGRLSHRNSLRARRLSAYYSVFKIQFKCHLLINLGPLQRVSHSFLSGPCLHQATAHGAFSDIGNSIHAETTCGSAGLLPNPQCLTHRCSNQSLHERLSERVRFLY